LRRARSSRGAFNSHVDYFTFLAAGPVAFLSRSRDVQRTNVMSTASFGVLPEILVAPIRRAFDTPRNAAAVLLITPRRLR